MSGEDTRQKRGSMTYSKIDTINLTQSGTFNCKYLFQIVIPSILQTGDLM